MSIFIDILGYASGTLIASSLIPQLVKCYKTKSCSDLSLSRYIMQVCAVCGWILYSILKHDIPLLATNIVSLGLTIWILVLIVRSKQKL